MSYPLTWSCPRCGHETRKTDQQIVYQEGYLNQAIVHALVASTEAACGRCGARVPLKELVQGKFDRGGGPAVPAAAIDDEEDSASPALAATIGAVVWALIGAALAWVFDWNMPLTAAIAGIVTFAGVYANNTMVAKARERSR